MNVRNSYDLSILVIYNNDFTSENEVSASSEEPPSSNDTYSGNLARASIKGVAYAVSDALTLLGYKSITVCPVEELKDIVRLVGSGKYDLVYNLVESLAQNSEMEVEVIKILERFKIPFTGNSSFSTNIALNKFKTTEVIRLNGGNIPFSLQINSDKELNNLPNLAYPLIVKPNQEDGSTGIDFCSVVHSKEELQKQVRKLLKQYQSSVVLQQYIDGREINVAVVGKKPNKNWSISEIHFNYPDPKMPKILNYASKWVDGAPEFHKSYSAKAELTNEILKNLMEDAKRVTSALNIESYARIDYRLDQDGTPFVIDVNPNCDLDPTAGLAKSAIRNNISYPELVEEILLNALEKFNSASNETFWANVQTLELFNDYSESSPI